MSKSDLAYQTPKHTPTCVLKHRLTPQPEPGSLPQNNLCLPQVYVLEKQYGNF